MKNPKRVEDYLEHIAEAVERAVGFIQELDNVETFAHDLKTQAAVIRCIEIIGEAATKIQKTTPHFIAAHPEIPRDDMRDTLLVDFQRERES